MIKPAPLRSVSLDHVAAVAGAAFAFDENAAGREVRRKPPRDRRAAVLAVAALVGLGGWLMRQFAA